MVVCLTEEKRLVIFEVACAWEPLVEEREKEKRHKYQELASDLSRQWPGYQISVIPVVVGDLGLITRLRGHLERAGIMTRDQIRTLMGEVQREVLCAAVKIVKRHMTTEELPGPWARQ